jgi:hypothetical protein
MLDAASARPLSQEERCSIHRGPDRCAAPATATVAKSGSVAHVTRLHVCAAHLAVYSPAAGWRRESPMAERQSIPVLTDAAVAS